jgi:cobalt/nickel transport system permease protein
VPLIFTRDGNILGDIDLRLFTLQISGEGLRDLGNIAFKSWVSVQAASLLVFTTRFHDLVHGLEQLRVPTLFVAVMSLMYRYMAVLTGESSRMMRARESRTDHVPGAKRPSVIWRAKQVGNMVGALFLRSLERSERVYLAMQARGYHGRMVRLGTRKLTAPETTAIVLGLIGLVTFSIVARLWLPIA